MIFIYDKKVLTVRCLVMNNLLPSCVKMHLKFDLKGSTYKRKVSIYVGFFQLKCFYCFFFVNIHPNYILLDFKDITLLRSR